MGTRRLGQQPWLSCEPFGRGIWINGPNLASRAAPTTAHADPPPPPRPSARRCLQSLIPRSSKQHRMQENLQLFNFDLTDAEMQAIDALDGTLQQQYAQQ